jgi:CRP-like cAMP-binding protein
METPPHRRRAASDSAPGANDDRSVPSPAVGAPVNRLLQALPAAVYDRLAPLMARVELSLRQTLYEPDATITHAYFPVDGCVSMVSRMDEGAVEVATIGNEGLVGVPLLLHAESTPSLVFVQVVGAADRIAAADLLAVMRESEAAEQLFYRYAQALFDQVAQNTACNRLHALEARCARWLLMTHDRVGAERGINRFALTHEFLSYMLGVHRPAVTLAAGVLQEAEVIRYHRGTITVIDRARLEGAACACYGIMRSAYEKLFDGAR